MPYLQREWSKYLGYGAPTPTYKLRTIPLVESVDLMAQGISAEHALGKEPSSDPPKADCVDRFFVIQLRNELTKQTEKFFSTKCAEPVVGSTEWSNFELNRELVLFKGTYSTIFACTSRQQPQVALVCRVFEPTALIDPDQDTYLRLLRHLGSQHPFIVPTWGIFVDASRRIYLMQQHASSGNAIDYVRAGNSVSEEQLCRWAQHIYSAMDFLGSMAVSHRSIYPKHLMLNRTASGETVAKLSGFRDAVIYWNPDTNSVIPQACKTLLEACSFHAPEMFGSKDGAEYFDALEADVWSYGCSMFYLIAGARYPFRVNDPYLELVIRNSIAELAITDTAKYWLFGLMRVNTAERTKFDAICKDDWFHTA